VVVGVIGDPVDHSLSPALHNAAFAELGLDWAYVAFPVPAGRAEAAVAAMVDLGGGVLAVRGGGLLHATAFPVGGILGTQSLEDMYRDLSGFEQAVRSLGSPLQNPFTSLAFASIPHIPHYGITDKGWYDTFAERFVDIILETEEGARAVDDSYAISVD